MNRLIEKVTLSKLDGSYIKLLNHLERQTLIITSQLPVVKWYEYIDDPTLTDTMMDRLTANASRIELKGESRRRKKQ